MGDFSQDLAPISVELISQVELDLFRLLPAFYKELSISQLVGFGWAFPVELFQADWFLRSWGRFQRAEPVSGWAGWIYSGWSVQAEQVFQAQLRFLRLSWLFRLIRFFPRSWAALTWFVREQFLAWLSLSFRFLDFSNGLVSNFLIISSSFPLLDQAHGDFLWKQLCQAVIALSYSISRWRPGLCCRV